MEKNEKTPPYNDIFPYAAVLVTIKDDDWEAVSDGEPYNSGNYSRIGGRGARWEVTGGDELGNEGIAFIESETMIVANFMHKFSDMNGTFAKLTRTTSLEETWISNEPASTVNVQQWELSLPHSTDGRAARSAGGAEQRPCAFTSQKAKRIRVLCRNFEAKVRDGRVVEP
jgi:hypothetical protein